MTVAFKTFGCRLNQAETAQFEDDFAAAGFRRVSLDTPADIIIVHSCAVTQKAEKEGLKQFRALRQKWPAACLVLAGCTVETLSSEARANLPADLLITRDEKARIVETVLQHLKAARPDIQSEKRHGAAVPSTPRPLTRSTQRASLKIQDGCDFFCAYCIVPHTRGAPVSTPFASVLSEARALIQSGFQELVITGCNIACYDADGHTLPDLLRALLNLPGLGRLRLGSIEPGTVERDIIRLMAESSRICRFLHLPLQSADDATLARMGRRYTAQGLNATLHDALRLMPDLALGADLICGFPGETEDAFLRTLALIAAPSFSKLHVFPYSERPGTPAASFDGKIPEAERKRRANRLIAQGQTNRSAFAQRFVQTPVECLVERFDAHGLAHGWSGEYLPCVISGLPRDRRRTLCPFTPSHTQGDTLFGVAT